MDLRSLYRWCGGPRIRVPLLVPVSVGGGEIGNVDVAATAQVAGRLVRRLFGGGHLQVECQRLHEPGSLLRRDRRRARQHSGRFQHAVRAGRTARHGVGVEHHEGQTSITLERMLSCENDDPLAFFRVEPMIARDPRVVLVDPPKATFPVVELADADADPAHTCRLVGVSVLSHQVRTKSTISSRVSWGTQRPVRAPQVLFLTERAPP